MEAFGWERMLKMQSLTPLASLFVATFLATNLLVLRILVYTLLCKSNESEVRRITSRAINVLIRLLTIHLKYTEMFAVHENLEELETIPLNSDRFSVVDLKFPTLYPLFYGLVNL